MQALVTLKYKENITKQASYVLWWRCILLPVYMYHETFDPCKFHHWADKTFFVSSYILPKQKNHQFFFVLNFLLPFFNSPSISRAKMAKVPCNTVFIRKPTLSNNYPSPRFIFPYMPYFYIPSWETWLLNREVYFAGILPCIDIGKYVISLCKHDKIITVYILQ